MATGLTTQIEVDGTGIAWIAGTNTKVKEVVLDKLAYAGARRKYTFSIGIYPWHRSIRLGVLLRKPG